MRIYSLDSGKNHMKNHRFLGLCSLFLVFYGNLLAQNTNFSLGTTPDSLKVYKSLDEAFKNPEKVYILDLGDQELGKIPPKIGQLVNLQQLYLYGNALKQIPPELGQLTNLRKLDLYNNELSSLPPDFTQLKQLVYLDVGENRFRAIPPRLLAMKSLTDLYIYGNRIRKIPDEITQLKSLESLRLGRGLRFFSGGNSIKSLPDNFGDLQNLRELYLPDNCLRQLPGSFSRLKKLQWLDLSYNRFQKIPPEIINLDSLQYLNLWDRGFSSEEKNTIQRNLPQTRFVSPKDYEGSFWGIVPGFQQGKFSVVEIGITRAFKKDILLIALGLGAEINLDASSQAFRLSTWANGIGIFSFGLHGLYYLENTRNNFAIRPEVGLGVSVFSIHYGYNILLRSGAQNINKHLISLKTIIPIQPFFSIFR